MVAAGIIPAQWDRSTYKKNSLCEREVVGADESAEVGGDFPGKLREVFARRVAREFIARCGSIRSNGDNRPVARIVGGRIGKHVKRLLRILQVVNANVEDDVRADRFASDEQAA